MTIQSLQEIIDRQVDSFNLPPSPSGLYEPINYLLGLGGKRMRPVLVLLGYSFFRDDPETIARQALSVEVFHNFTLMHDDIMDRAPIRRGQPTVHKKWNETTAILSGDAMLIKAYQLIEDLPDRHLSESFRLFNKCALEVCEGQQLDLDLEAVTEATADEYLEMVRLKTAVLVGYSLQFGGLLADQDNTIQRQLHQLGESMGMAFQLMDDHLDTFGTESFGKKIGGDILSEKKTFLLISALQTEYRKKIQDTSALSGAEKIEVMTSLFRQAGVEELSKEKIKNYSDQAIALLDEMPGNTAVRELLVAYITELNSRVI